MSKRKRGNKKFEAAKRMADAEIKTSHIVILDDKGSRNLTKSTAVQDKAKDKRQIDFAIARDNTNITNLANSNDVVYDCNMAQIQIKSAGFQDNKKEDFSRNKTMLVCIDNSTLSPMSQKESSRRYEDHIVTKDFKSSQHISLTAKQNQNFVRNEFNFTKVLPSIKTLIDHLPAFPRVKSSNKNKNNKFDTVTLNFAETCTAGADEKHMSRVKHQHQQEGNENQLESVPNKMTTYLPHPPPSPPISTKTPGRLPSRNTTPDFVVGKVAERLRTRILTSAKEHNFLNHQDHSQGIPKGSNKPASVRQRHQQPLISSLTKNHTLLPISNDHHNKNQSEHLSINDPQQLARKLATMKGILKPTKVDKDVLKFCDPLVKPRGDRRGRDRITIDNNKGRVNMNDFNNYKDLKLMNRRFQIQPTIVTVNGATLNQHEQYQHAMRRDFGANSAVQRQLTKLYDKNTSTVNNRSSGHHLPPLLANNNNNNNKNVAKTTLAPSVKSRIARKREESLKNRNKNPVTTDQQHQRTNSTLPKKLQPLPTVASSKTNYSNTSRLSYYSASRSQHNQRPPSAGHRRFGALDMGFQNNVTYFHNPRNFL